MNNKSHPDTTGSTAAMSELNAARAEAAEAQVSALTARVGVLEGALQDLVDVLGNPDGLNRNLVRPTYDVALAALRGRDAGGGEA